MEWHRVVIHALRNIGVSKQAVNTTICTDRINIFNCV